MTGITRNRWPLWKQGVGQVKLIQWQREVRKKKKNNNNAMPELRNFVAGISLHWHPTSLFYKTSYHVTAAWNQDFVAGKSLRTSYCSAYFSLYGSNFRCDLFSHLSDRSQMLELDSTLLLELRIWFESSSHLVGILGKSRTRGRCWLSPKKWFVRTLSSLTAHSRAEMCSS